MVLRFTNVLLAFVLAVPLPVFAFYHQTGLPGRSDVAPGRQQALSATPTPIGTPTASPTPTPEILLGKLRKPEHAKQLERVRGIIRGMTNKLQNLSRRIDVHLRNFERRIAVLEAAGHDITVDSELAAARAAVAKTQATIADILNKLSAIPDSETPRALAQEVRGLVRGLRGEFSELRSAFKALQEAVRDDVSASQASPSPSPSPTLTPTPTPTPTP